MKKLLYTLALIGTFSAMSVQAESLLYWMVDVNTQTSDANVTPFTYAQLVAYNNEGAEVSGFRTRDGASVDWSSGNASYVTGVSLDGLTGYESWTFAVELYNDTWKRGVTDEADRLDWANITAMDAFYKSTQPGGAGVAKFTTFTYNAPEPTSGLLILLGVCGLALKRKRA